MRFALCAPSRACLVTGREYDRCGVPDNETDLPAGSPTFFRRLRDGGYHVMGVGKVDLAKGSRTWGIDGKRHQESLGFSDLVDCCGKIDGMLAYYGVRSSLDVRPRDGQEGKRPRPEEPYLAYLDALDPPRAGDFADDMLARVKGRKPELAYGDTRPSPLDDPHYLDNWIGRRGLEMIEAAPRDRPWFQMVNFAGPHAPTDVTRRMDALYRGPERIDRRVPATARLRRIDRARPARRDPPELRRDDREHRPLARRSTSKRSSAAASSTRPSWCGRATTARCWAITASGTSRCPIALRPACRWWSRARASSRAGVTTRW